MTRICLFILIGLISASFAASPEPKRDIKYDTRHVRNVLDFWPALKSDTPAPVYVFFHGGGFRGGDKSQLERNRGESIKVFREAGFAVVSCNYPFLEQGMDYRTIVGHCGRAVQFIRSKASEWNLDPGKVVSGGVSAGALISGFLGYHDDLAEVKSKDPVARESTRANVVVSIMQPIGTNEFALRYMDKGEAPLFVYSDARPSDRIHPPAQAILIKNKAEKLDIPVVIYGGGRNEIPKVPEGKNWLQLQVEFCKKHLMK